MNNKPRFEIGTQYLSHGKAPRLCTVVDIYTTFNSKGEMIGFKYLAQHDFLGQTLSYEVVETTVFFGIERLQQSKTKGKR